MKFNAEILVLPRNRFHTQVESFKSCVNADNREFTQHDASAHDEPKESRN